MYIRILKHAKPHHFQYKDKIFHENVMHCAYKFQITVPLLYSYYLKIHTRV